MDDNNTYYSFRSIFGRRITARAISACWKQEWRSTDRFSKFPSTEKCRWWYISPTSSWIFERAPVPVLGSRAGRRRYNLPSTGPLSRIGLFSSGIERRVPRRESLNRDIANAFFAVFSVIIERSTHPKGFSVRRLLPSRRIPGAKLRR